MNLLEVTSYVYKISYFTESSQYFYKNFTLGVFFIIPVMKSFYESTNGADLPTVCCSNQKNSIGSFLFLILCFE